MRYNNLWKSYCDKRLMNGVEKFAKDVGKNQGLVSSNLLNGCLSDSNIKVYSPVKKWLQARSSLGTCNPITAIKGKSIRSATKQVLAITNNKCIPQGNLLAHNFSSAANPRETEHINNSNKNNKIPQKKNPGKKQEIQQSLAYKPTEFLACLLDTQTNKKPSLKTNEWSTMQMLPLDTDRWPVDSGLTDNLLNEINLEYESNEKIRELMQLENNQEKPDIRIKEITPMKETSEKEQLEEWRLERKRPTHQVRNKEQRQRRKKKKYVKPITEMKDITSDIEIRDKMRESRLKKDEKVKTIMDRNEITFENKIRDIMQVLRPKKDENMKAITDRNEITSENKISDIMRDLWSKKDEKVKAITDRNEITFENKIRDIMRDLWPKKDEKVKAITDRNEITFENKIRDTMRDLWSKKDENVKAIPGRNEITPENEIRYIMPELGHKKDVKVKPIPDRNEITSENKIRDKMAELGPKINEKFKAFTDRNEIIFENKIKDIMRVLRPRKDEKVKAIPDRKEITSENKIRDKMAEVRPKKNEKFKAITDRKEMMFENKIRYKMREPRPKKDVKLIAFTDRNENSFENKIRHKMRELGPKKDMKVKAIPDRNEITSENKIRDKMAEVWPKKNEKFKAIPDRNEITSENKIKDKMAEVWPKKNEKFKAITDRKEMTFENKIRYKIREPRPKKDVKLKAFTGRNENSFDNKIRYKMRELGSKKDEKVKAIPDRKEINSENKIRDKMAELRPKKNEKVKAIRHKMRDSRPEKDEKVKAISDRKVITFENKIRHKMRESRPEIDEKVKAIPVIKEITFESKIRPKMRELRPKKDEKIKAIPDRKEITCEKKKRNISPALELKKNDQLKPITGKKRITSDNQMRTKISDEQLKNSTGRIEGSSGTAKQVKNDRKDTIEKPISRVAPSQKEHDVNGVESEKSFKNDGYCSEKITIPKINELSNEKIKRINGMDSFSYIITQSLARRMKEKSSYCLGNQMLHKIRRSLPNTILTKPTSFISGEKMDPDTEPKKVKIEKKIKLLKCRTPTKVENKSAHLSYFKRMNPVTSKMCDIEEDPIQCGLHPLKGMVTYANPRGDKSEGLGVKVDQLENPDEQEDVVTEMFQEQDEPQTNEKVQAEYRAHIKPTQTEKYKKTPFIKDTNWGYPLFTDVREDSPVIPSDNQTRILYTPRHNKKSQGSPYQNVNEFSFPVKCFFTSQKLPDQFTKQDWNEWKKTVITVNESWLKGNSLYNESCSR